MLFCSISKKPMSVQVQEVLLEIWRQWRSKVNLPAIPGQEDNQMLKKNAEVRRSAAANVSLRGQSCYHRMSCSWWAPEKAGFDGKNVTTNSEGRPTFCIRLAPATLCAGWALRAIVWWDPWVMASLLNTNVLKNLSCKKSPHQQFLLLSSPLHKNHCSSLQ